MIVPSEIDCMSRQRFSMKPLGIATGLRAAWRYGNGLGDLRADVMPA